MKEPDEPPLSSQIHSWTRDHLNPFTSSSGHSASDTKDRDKDVLPQHEKHDPTNASKANPSDGVIQHQDTEKQDSSVVDKKGDGAKPTTIDEKPVKASIFKRAYSDVKYILFCSWVNVLLIAVPVGIILGGMVKANEEHPIVSPSAVFAVNAIAIIPLASLLSFATENVASKLGDTIGALLNVTFGNAVELIIFIIALVANEIRIVQASLLGSILANLLLILGMSFVFGGLRFREQLYNCTSAQLSACLLSLSVVSLLLPTAFHASFNNLSTADHVVLKVSRGTSVVLLLVYVIYLLFQLKSHAYMYESTPQHLIDEESHPGILAEMMNSSSDDSSSSSSSDSSSSDESKTTSRIKRALRRKRRKSHSSSKDSASTPSFKRTPSSNTDNTRITNEIPQTESPGQMSPLPSRHVDGILSGDEADTNDETKSKRKHAKGGVTSRDFEQEQPPSDKSKSKKDKKKRKGWRRKKVSDSAKNTIEEVHAEPVVEDYLNHHQTTVGFAPEVQEIPGPNQTRTPFMRNISAMRPNLPKGLSSAFVHHEATGRSLPYPARHITPIPQRSVTPVRAQMGNELRRTASLPDNLQNRPHAITANTGVVPTASGPLPHLAPTHQPTLEAKAPEAEEERHLSQTSAVILLLVSTGLVAICAEFLVDSINFLVETSGVSQAFIGLIILPIVGNAAEHVTAVTVASKNKMDLAINVALGSSIQIALFVTPLIVLLGWCMDRDMSLYFSLFETVSLFASAFIVNYLMIDGRSNYLEGALLIAAYVIIAVAAFFYPPCGGVSSAASGPAGAAGSC